MRETLSMLKKGTKASEIAGKRGLTLGTIEAHIAQLIKAGDIHISQCMEEDKIDNIVSVIREIKAVSLQPVKERLGDHFTYGEIRAVMNHLQYMEKSSSRIA